MAKKSPRLPSWVEALQKNPELMPRGQSLRWLSAQEGEAYRRALLARWDEASFGEEFGASCRARLVRSLPVAIGPSRRARLAGREETLLLLFDPQHPEDLFASFGDRLPALLWVPLGKRAETLQSRLAPYLLRATTAAHALPRVVRIFKGTAKELGVDTLEDLTAILTAFETWLDPAFWGSAFDEDPWPEDTSSLSMLRLRVLLDETRRQSPGRFPSYSFRTLWSKSIFRIEQHPFGGFVFELRYEPLAQPEVIRELEEVLPLRLPEDLPVDLAASLLRGPTVTPLFLSEALKQEGEAPYLALAQCAIAPWEASSEALLRSMLSSPETRPAALDLALAYSYRGLLLETLAATDDDALREQLEEALAPRVPPPRGEQPEEEDEEDLWEKDDEEVEG